jgi:hypothetical protein
MGGLSEMDPDPSDADKLGSNLCERLWKVMSFQDLGQSCLKWLEKVRSGSKRLGDLHDYHVHDLMRREESELRVR